MQNSCADSACKIRLLRFGDGATVDPTSGTAGARQHTNVDASQLGVGRHGVILAVFAPRMTRAKVYRQVPICISTPLDANDGTPPVTVVQTVCNIVPPPWRYSSGIAVTGQPGQTAPITTQITVTGSDDKPLQFAVNAGSDAPSGLSIYPARDVATGTPTTVTVMVDPARAPSTNFSQRVDWPVTIHARLVDNCGQAASGASVRPRFQAATRPARSTCSSRPNSRRIAPRT